MARAGLHVVLVCRDGAGGRAAVEWIAREAAGASLEVRLCELSSLRGTRRLGADIAAEHPRLALLVNNAGMFTARRQITGEGLETILAVNHLAPVVLTDALQQALKAGAPSRIVNVGSSTSDRARIDPDDLQLARGWGMARAYSQSKLALMIETFDRARRLRCAGVVANVVHPGAVATSLVRERGPIALAWRLMTPFLLSEEQGADTPVHVARAPEWAEITGAYVKNRTAVPPNPRALNPVLAAQVVAASRALIDSAVNGGEAESRNLRDRK
jgi:NAD(P)-dependent dehydrogenase (short-subunit alcohol dehydrogenase family)